MRTRTREVSSGLAVPRRRSSALPIERSVLRNGLRVVTTRMPSARSVAVGLFVGVGSRHEDAPRAGLSHFLEHLVFKGTGRYPEPGALSQIALFRLSQLDPDPGALGSGDIGDFGAS